MEKPPGLTPMEETDWQMKHQGIGCGAWMFLALVLVVAVMVVESLMHVEIPWWQTLVLAVVGVLWFGFATSE